MFGAMMDGIKEESVGNLFNLVVQVQENPIVEEEGAAADGAMAAAPPVEAPDAAGPTGRRVVPAQATGQPPASGAAPASGSAPASARPGAASARSGQGGAAAKRDGRVGGAQSGAAANRGGRASGAHARPAGAPAAPVTSAAPVPAGLAPRRPQRLQYSAPSVDGGTHVETSQAPGPDDDFARVGRNDPCPCGSGRKFKRCHGDPRNAP
jgi:preprotein translocase subunit SecA